MPTYWPVPDELMTEILQEVDFLTIRKLTKLEPIKPNCAGELQKGYEVVCSIHGELLSTGDWILSVDTAHRHWETKHKPLGLAHRPEKILQILEFE